MSQSTALFLPDEAATIAYGEAIGRALSTHQRSLSVHLLGDLGAGKTTMTRGLLRAFGHHGAVKSPTYTLVEEYDLALRRLYHFDLYRLGDAEELEYMGIRDYFSSGSLCLIEWPQRGAGVLPAADIIVELTPHTDARVTDANGQPQQGRLVRLSGPLMPQIAQQITLE